VLILDSTDTQVDLVTASKCAQEAAHIVKQKEEYDTKLKECRNKLVESHNQLKSKISTLSDSMKIDFAQKSFEISQKAHEAMTGSHIEMKKMQLVFKSIEKDKAALVQEGFKILTQPDLVKFPELVEMYTEAYKDLLDLTQEVTGTFVSGFESFFEDAEDDLQKEVDQLKQVFAGAMQSANDFRQKLGLNQYQFEKSLNQTLPRKYSYRAACKNILLTGHCCVCGDLGPVNYHWPHFCPSTGKKGVEETRMIATGLGYFVSKCCGQPEPEDNRVACLGCM